MNKFDLENQLESMVLIYLKDRDSTPHKEEIEEQVRKTANAFGWNHLDISGIVKRIESKLVINMDVGVSLINQDDPHDEDWIRTKEGITWNYWRDYEDLLSSERFGPKIVHTMGEVTDKILGLLKDPDEPGIWDRRGLVIGHVQSGKTSNYIGLIAKAADAGYSFIIVIAGIHNNLRKQTQERIDEGFVGRDSSTRKRVGVGRINRTRAFPITLTNTLSDFNKNAAKTITADLKAFDVPVILVIKKHVSILSHLYSWLKELNADQDGEIANFPMLLIDDEADNASINTNKPEVDPTRTNKEIRKLLKLFKKSCYIGYTATPFANIFINPESDKDMLGDDLFPRDFIYCLDAPSNYIGAQKIFLDNDMSKLVLRTINDAEDLIPLNHKQYFEIIDLPQSIKQSIITFLLARAIRLARNQIDQHCSMMINVSRFVHIQRQVRDYSSLYLKELKDAIRYNYAKPPSEALKNKIMSNCKAVFDNEFSDTGHEWEIVQGKMMEASDAIKIFLINSKSDEVLDYAKYEKAKETLTVVAVGGLSLSRGLTLEGLTVSYMYRNTKMYDTLMQMGRWFGYRPGYGDLCRIYLPEESQGWYSHIAEATENLIQQVRQMRRDGLKPIEFGLYVRAHPDALIVTALNKMRHAEKKAFKIHFDGILKETHILPSSKKISRNNIDEMINFYNNLCTINGKPDSKEKVFWSDIDLDQIINFLQNFRFHRMLGGLKDSLISYSKELSDIYPKWDVALVTLKKSAPSLDGLPMASQERQVGRDNNFGIKKTVDEEGWYVGNKQSVSGTGIEKIGLTETQLDDAKLIAKEAGRDEPSDADCRHKSIRGKPFLMLHLLRLFNKTNSEKVILAENIPAIGISFPATGIARSVKCMVNRVWIQQDMYDSPDEEDDYGN